MNVYLGTSEHILISEKILQEAAVEQLPDEQARHIAKEEGIHFGDVLNLCLEYRNILRIEHLWEFTSLVRLNLNNNAIQKIEGLACLVNLTSLNLSSNNIEKIEGLESLSKLEVLNLSNNRISVLENMDTLVELTHFNIAHNSLGKLDNVLYLRKLKNLFTLSLFGNPICTDGDYNLFIAAYFPKLTFLDYNLLDKATKNEASVKYHSVLEEMRRKEVQMQKAEEAEQSLKAEIQLHTDAFVEYLNGSYLFKSMLKDDQGAEMIHCIPGVAPLLQTFEPQMVDLCMKLFKIGLAEHEQRQAEVSSFLSGQMDALTDSQKRTSQLLAKFEEQHKESLAEMQQISDPDQLRVKIQHCNNDMNQLCNSLMALEFQLVTQLEDFIRTFNTSISDMVANFIENAQGIFAQCRDLEENYHEKLWEIAVTTLENVAQDKVEVDMPDDVKILLSERETVMDALSASHDNHLLKINDRETELITRVNAWKVTLIDGVQDKAIKHHRMRLSDIHRYVDYLREQLEELQ